MINRSAENETDRRVFLKAASAAGLGTIGAGAATVLGASSASAAGRGPSDAAIFNFALNLEYLEAQFYHYAAYGTALPFKLTTGKGDRGGVVGGHKVPFKTPAIASMAREIAQDEKDHVRFIRKTLGGAAVAQPKIDLKNSFTAAATAAGLIKPGQSFDPFADEDSFLLGAFIFEDVGVTAYKGAAPLIDNKAFLGAAAGILAVEAYHAGIIRTRLYDRNLFDAVKAISNARDSLDGKTDVDQGIGRPAPRKANLVPTNRNALAFSRTPGQVLNVVYLNPKSVKQGGFYPKGVNGAINKSS
ncbi:MAG: ferritin-like domain-containing protein [Nocardioides sp.]